MTATSLKRKRSRFQGIPQAIFALGRVLLGQHPAGRCAFRSVHGFRCEMPIGADGRCCVWHARQDCDE